MTHWPMLLRLTFIINFNFELNLHKRAHYRVERREQPSWGEETIKRGERTTRHVRPWPKGQQYYS